VEMARTGGIVGWEQDIRSGEIFGPHVLRDRTRPGGRPPLGEGDPLGSYVEEDRQRLAKALSACAERAEPFDLELRGQPDSGSPSRYRVTGRAVLEEGRITKLRGVIQDIGERELVRATLQEKDKFIDLLARNSANVVWTINMDGRFTFISPSVLPLFGYTVQEALDIPLDQYLTPDSFELVKTRLAEQLSLPPERRSPSETFEAQQYTRDGRVVDIEIHASWILDENGRHAGIQGSTREITQRKRLEERLRQSQKMEAIATLAGGIAHDFNNFLSIVYGNADLALQRVPADSPSRPYLEEIRSAGKRATEVVGQLMRFARNVEPKREAVDLGAAVNDVLRMLRPLIPPGVQVRAVLPQEDGTVLADPTQIHQVLVNLCMNAIQAMNKAGGVLGICLDGVEMDERQAHRHPGLKAGSYRRLRVADTGTGVSPHVLHRVFEPYFSTKEVGDGTGLGLSVAHGIVLAHRGGLSMENNPDRGVTVTVLLPVPEGVVASATAP